jgi:hypothetical protein
VGELTATAGDAALDGAEGEVEHLGDLGVVQVGDVSKDDRDPEVLGELGQGVVDGLALTDGVDPAFGVRVEWFGRTGIGVGHDMKGRASAATATFVERGIGGDAIDPRCHGGTTVEAGESPHNGDHGLLGGVVGITGGAEDAAAHGVDEVVVAPQQRVERLPIAALGSGHERAVVGVSDAVTVVQRRVLVGFGQGAKVTSERVERYGF